jgi:hypothetical protein
MRRIAFAAAILALFACGGSSAVAPKPDNVQAEAGTYNLTIVGGSPIPVAVANAGATSILSAVVTLNVDFTYTQTANYKTKGPPVVLFSTSESGTFDLKNSAVTFHPTGAATYQGAVGDGVLVYVYPAADTATVSGSVFSSKQYKYIK